jgi:hypothetical protein
MSKDKKFTAVFKGADRLPNSSNGNPRWLLLTSEGNYGTEPDASLGYEVSNHLHSTLGLVGKRVEFTATESRAGRLRVWDMKEASEQ